MRIFVEPPPYRRKSVLPVPLNAVSLIMGRGWFRFREDRIMALHAETAARTRLATYSKNHCPQCSEWLLAPDWSEYFNDHCVRHTWSCQSCGYEFETAVFFAPREDVAA